MEIYLIRHTSVNCEKGICYGQTDTDVSDSFNDEIQEIKNKINTEDHIFYTSPLKRCLKLTQSLTISDFHIDQRLKEINFGDWELKRWDSIDKQELQTWINDYTKVSCPNGECFNDIYLRSVDFFKDLLQKNHKKVAIITHAGIIRCLIAHILEIPLKKAVALNIDYGSITKIHIDNQLINVAYINK